MITGTADVAAWIVVLAQRSLHTIDAVGAIVGLQSCSCERSRKPIRESRRLPPFVVALICTALRAVPSRVVTRLDLNFLHHVRFAVMTVPLLEPKVNHARAVDLAHCFVRRGDH